MPGSGHSPFQFFAMTVEALLVEDNPLKLLRVFLRVRVCEGLGYERRFRLWPGQNQER